MRSMRKSVAKTIYKFLPVLDCIDCVKQKLEFSDSDVKLTRMRSTCTSNWERGRVQMIGSNLGHGNTAVSAGGRLLVDIAKRAALDAAVGAKAFIFVLFFP